MVRYKALFLVLIILPALSYGAELKERQLEGFRAAFRAKVISDNPGREQEVRTCLEGMIREGGAGVKLIDKFGLFLYDSGSNNLLLERARFIRDGNSSVFILLLKDSMDGQAYSLFLEYMYNPAKGTYTLGEIYFSKVFEERMGSVRDFFGGD